MGVTAIDHILNVIDIVNYWLMRFVEHIGDKNQSSV